MIDNFKDSYIITSIKRTKQGVLNYDVHVNKNNFSSHNVDITNICDALMIFNYIVLILSVFYGLIKFGITSTFVCFSAFVGLLLSIFAYFICKYGKHKDYASKANIDSLMQGIASDILGVSSNRIMLTNNYAMEMDFPIECTFTNVHVNELLGTFSIE